MTMENKTQQNTSHPSSRNTMETPRGPFNGPYAKSRAKHTGTTLRRIWHYLHQQKIGLLIVCILAVMSSGLALAGPYLIGIAIDHYIIPRESNGLMQLCVLMLAIYFVSSVTSWLQTYVMVGVTQRTVREMRLDLFSRLQQLPLRFFDGKTHGELMSRTTNDMENVSASLSQSMIQFISSLITIIGALGMMLALDVWLTLVSLISIPLVMFVTRSISGRTRAYFKAQQQNLGELNGFIEETISGQKVVKIFHREAKTLEQFQNMNRALKNVGTKAQILSGTIGPVMNVVNNLSFLLIAAVGGWMALKGFLTLGIIVSFLNYSKQFGRPINELASQYNMIQSGIAGAERVFEILDTESEYKHTDGNNLLRYVSGHVVFDDVSFRYKKETPVLKHISFTANPGDTIALVGPTGTGKTTIVNLLTRFYDIDQGTITIDGIKIRSVDKDSLRKHLGIVLQDAYLFSDTIRENIRYGRLDATDEEVEAAARLANADGFIMKLPHGYDTPLTAEGGNLSHGQRQLVTIARAILADPAILILDEATSNIDTRTEMYIQKAMDTLMKGRTSFVIAHRLSTIRNADMILVLNNGEIIERGTHEQLLAYRGFYYELYTNQLRQTI